MSFAIRFYYRFYQIYVKDIFLPQIQDIEKFYELNQQLTMDDLARKKFTHTQVRQTFTHTQVRQTFTHTQVRQTFTHTQVRQTFTHTHR